MSPEDALIERFMAVFGEPRTINPEMFLKEFAKAITGWPADVLEKAGDEMIRSSTFWPKPGEINGAAEQLVAAKFKPDAYPVPNDLEKPDPVMAARVMRLVKDAIRTIQTQSSEMEIGTEPNWERGQRPQFEEMMENSPNHHLYRPRQLSTISKRITGERDE